MAGSFRAWDWARRRGTGGPHGYQAGRSMAGNIPGAGKANMSGHDWWNTTRLRGMALPTDPGSLHGAELWKPRFWKPLFLTVHPALGQEAVVLDLDGPAGRWGTASEESIGRRLARDTGLELRPPQRLPAEGPAGRVTFTEPNAVWQSCGRLPAVSQVERFLGLVAAEQFAWILVGSVDPQWMARRLCPGLRPDLLLIAFPRLGRDSPEVTEERESWDCYLHALAALDITRMTDSAAAHDPVCRALMALALGLHWEGVLCPALSQRSTEAATSPADRPGPVVVFLDPPVGRLLTAEERRLALHLARRSIVNAVETGRLPRIDRDALPLALLVPRACFVTLTRRGQLRGCIGLLTAQLPLYQAIVENAMAAALHDYRFEPVAPFELQELHIEISILTPAQPLRFDGPEDLLQQLEPGRDGVILRVGVRSATFLPQVWEKLPDKRQFMTQLALKAGCAPDAWRSPEAKVEVYQVEAFAEPA